MGCGSSDGLSRQVRRLFQLGVVGTMSDLQLLERFCSRRDEAAEVAFEELVVRHGPMVLRKPGLDEPAIAYQMTGSVRVEGTGEPVAGGRFSVLLGDVSYPDRSRLVTSGPDGQFRVDLPPGQAQAWTFWPPVGYWAPGNGNSQETFVLSRAQPVHQRDYLVRRGTVWRFQLLGADGKTGEEGSVQTSTPNATFLSDSDEPGRASLTLPIEAGNVVLGILKGKRLARSFDSVPISVPLEWVSGFRPETVKTVERTSDGYRLKDDAGRIATIGRALKELPGGAGPPVAIGNSGRVEPILIDGKLVIRAVFSNAGRLALGRLAGRVVDGSGRPIEGVRIALAFHTGEGKRAGSVFPDDREHEGVSDHDGRFVIGSIPILDVMGKPTNLSLVVRKDGFGALDTPIFTFQPGKEEVPHEFAAIRLGPGVSLSGTVVGADGQPVEGVWVTPDGGYAMRSLFARTDAQGKFTVRNLPKGMVKLGFSYGDLGARGTYFADGTGDGINVTLRTRAEMFAKPAAPKVVEPPALGTPAPALRVGDWSDGKTHSLADYGGKVVFLDFWGMWCGPCVNELRSVERLKQKYEPKGVVFLSIHTPGEPVDKVRRFLDLQKTTGVSAVDVGLVQRDDEHNGITAKRYGVKNYPTIVMIDRKGNLAFHSGIGTPEGVAAMRALGKEMGLAEATMTEADFYRLWEAFFGREIEKVLGRP